MEGDGPGPRQGLLARFGYVSGHTHDNRTILAEVYHLERCDRLDFRIAALVDFVFRDRQVADHAVALVAQNGFQKQTFIVSPR